LLITILRLFRSQKLWYALAGLGAALLAVGLWFVLDRTEVFFLPAIINGGLTTFILYLPILIKRSPMAFASHLAWRWTLGWYWLPKSASCIQRGGDFLGRIFGFKTHKPDLFFPVWEYGCAGFIQFADWLVYAHPSTGLQLHIRIAPAALAGRSLNRRI